MAVGGSGPPPRGVVDLRQAVSLPRRPLGLVELRAVVPRQQRRPRWAGLSRSWRAGPGIALPSSSRIIPNFGWWSWVSVVVPRDVVRFLFRVSPLPPVHASGSCPQSWGMRRSVVAFRGLDCFCFLHSPSEPRS